MKRCTVEHLTSQGSAQQNSDPVEDFISPYSAVYLRIQKCQSYRKNKSGTFFYGPRYIYGWPWP